ncbi:MAG: phosphoglycerate mutase family protein [Cellvibrionaceae bacterium]|nr:phosphoglycerate mutase family protein [Cellvibrionaceae bacterium]MCV6627169.1 phosphoglycerate mutase family protein [Cellvibrionaceae bacterium]
MAKIILVRHGQAAAGWGTDPDPGLSELGRQQAREAASALAAYRGFQILSSPKARAQETAAIATEGFSGGIRIEPRVIEIPSGERPLSERGSWLKQVFSGSWGEQESQVQNWRNKIVAMLTGLEKDTIIFCHFVVINGVLAAAKNSDRVLQAKPDYCSTWVFETDGEGLSIIASGAEDKSLVL